MESDMPLTESIASGGVMGLQKEEMLEAGAEQLWDPSPCEEPGVIAGEGQPDAVRLEPRRELELSAGALIPDEIGERASDLMEKDGGVRESLWELELVGVIGFFSFGGDLVSVSEFVTIGFP